MTRHDWARFRRCLVPALLIVAAFWLLGGCIYLPLPQSMEREGQVDPRQVIHATDAKKPIVPNRATRQQVVAILGEPDRISADGRVIGYWVRYRKGVWVVPLCLTSMRAKQDIGLRLEFDSAGILRKYEMTEMPAPQYLLNSYTSDAPANVIRQMLDDIGKGPERWSRPLTEPTPGPTIPDGSRYETR